MTAFKSVVSTIRVNNKRACGSSCDAIFEGVVTKNSVKMEVFHLTPPNSVVKVFSFRFEPFFEPHFVAMCDQQVAMCDQQVAKAADRLTMVLKWHALARPNYR